jgi:protein tyrosine/serine phosphatase
MKNDMNTRTSPVRRRAALYLLLAAVLVVAAGIVAYHKLGPYHFQTVTPGVLYRGGQQNLHILGLLADRYHFKTIVSFREPGADSQSSNWYEPEKEFCRKRGITFYNIPMHGKEPPSPEQVRQWLDIMRDRDRYPVFVHCAQGVIRTGAMVAVYQIGIEHRDNRTVWEQLPRFGHDFTQPSMEPLKEFILNFKPQ